MNELLQGNHPGQEVESLPKEAKPLHGLKPRREATPEEMEAIKCLATVRYAPATFDKRFACEIQGVTQITEGQSAQVWRIFKRYRRQIKHAQKDALLAMADTLTSPEHRTSTDPLKISKVA